MKSNNRLFIEKYISINTIDAHVDLLEQELSLAIEKDDGWIKIEDKKGLNLGSEYIIYMSDITRVCSAFWL